MALISVITSAYNVAPFIAEAIESVMAQTISDWEHVIVDDGSTDDTAQIVERYCAKDPRITLIRQGNAGNAAARNAGALASQSTFISLLDADDAYEPLYLETMTGKLLSCPELAFTCCDAYSFSGPRKDGIRCSTTSPMAGAITLERVAMRHIQIFGSITLRRDWFEKMGGYDAQMRSSEDLDMSIRLLSAGARAAYIDRPLVWYRRYPGSVSGNTPQLVANTLGIYERLKTTHPEIEAKCRDYQNRLRYSVHLYQVKKSLAAREYDTFAEHCKNALAMRKSWKLLVIFIISRLSPALARWAFTISR